MISTCHHVSEVIKRIIIFGTACTLLGEGCNCRGLNSKDTQFYHQLAAHYSPVYIQAAATSQDYITRFDYDGDYTGNNNWENQSEFPLRAFVYFDVKETETHWFVHYAFYHPRDYLPDCDNPPSWEGCHENDAEQVLLVIERDGLEFGTLVSMEAQAHVFVNLYVDDPEIASVADSGTALFNEYEIEKENGHPVVYSEVYAHGIYGNINDIIEEFEGWDTICYRYGAIGEEPRGIPDEVSYDLLSIYDTLWQLRDEVGDGKTFGDTFAYGDMIVPGTFDGDNYEEDGCVTFWGHSLSLMSGSELKRGDWFFDPARTVQVHQGIEEIDDYPFSLVYTYNPYLAR